MKKVSLSIITVLCFLNSVTAQYNGGSYDGYDMLDRISCASPYITAHPANSSICVSQNATYSLTVTGTGLTYQWYRSSDGGSSYSSISEAGYYSGTTTATLTITGPTTGFTGYMYRCFVSNTCGSVYSTGGTLTVNAAPAIATHPSNSTVCAGTSATFTVGATGTGLTYQWYKSTDGGSTYLVQTNGSTHSGCTTYSMTATGPGAGMNGNMYKCVVTASCGLTVTSNAATLTVNSPPSITTQPVNTSACAGSNATFTVTAAGAGLTYQWNRSTDGGATWSAVSGGTSATLTVTGVSSGMNGYKYYCQITGTCSPAVSSNSATLAVNTLPAILTQPASSAVCPGGSTGFSITGSGTGLTYQWQLSTDGGTVYNNITSSGTSPVYTGWTTSTLNLSSTVAGNNGYKYRCIVSGTCSPSITSNVVTLSIFTVPDITTHPSDVEICPNNGTSFTCYATGTGITYQWQVSTDGGTVYNNITMGGSYPSYSGYTSSSLGITGAYSNNSGYKYRCIATGTCSPAATSNPATLTVYSTPAVTSHPSNSAICVGGSANFTAAVSGTLTGYTFQWQVSTNGGGTYSNITSAGTNPTYSNWTTTTLGVSGIISGNNNYKYRCAVLCCTYSPVNSNTATLTVYSPPVISFQPTNKTVCEGSITSFNVVASGAGLTYQWENSSDAVTWTPIPGGTFQTLTLSSVTADMNGMYGRCVVTGTCAPPATSNYAQLTVNTAPVITLQPADAETCENDDATFMVTATGTGLTYQWYQSSNGGSTWSAISGATSFSLNLTNVTLAMNNYYYGCVVTGTCSPEATSTSAILTVHSLPAITSQPSNRYKCEGTNANFSVTATGSSLAYQWQVSTDLGSTFNDITTAGTNPVYSGWTTNTLNLNTVAIGNNNYQYRCVVSGLCEPVTTSNAVSLFVYTPPAITSQPSDQETCANQNALFSLAATGAGLAYQWQESINGGTTWNNVSGATASTLSLNNVPYSMNNNLYRCNISGACDPPIASDDVLLSVVTAPAVTVQPTGAIVCEGSPASFNVTATGGALTYQWQVSVNGGSTYSDILAAGTGPVYSNWNTSSLGLTGVVSGNNNYLYRCTIIGLCSPSSISNSGLLTVENAPAVSDQPNNSTIGAGGNTSFDVLATGNGLSYQWQVSTDDGAIYTNITASGSNPVYANWSTSSLALIGVIGGNDGNLYRCLVSGTCTPPDTSDVALLTVNTAPAITLHPVSTTVCAGVDTAFTVTAAGATGYQWEVSTDGGFVYNPISSAGTNPMYAGWISSTLDVSAIISGNTGFKYRCVVSGMAPPDATSNPAILTVNVPPVVLTDPSNSNVCEGHSATFSVTASGSELSYQWQKSSNSGGSWTNVGSNLASFTISSAGIGMDNNLYRCIVSGSCSPCDTSGNGKLFVRRYPSITTQTDDIVICEGADTYFAVDATGTALTYQWFVSANAGLTWDAIAIDGNSDTLNLTSVPASWSNNIYHCEVNGSCASIQTSASAQLSVTTHLAITQQPAGISVCEGSDAGLSIAVSGTNVSYQWQESADGGSVWDNLAGENTSTLTLTGVLASMNNYKYHCVLNGDCSGETSSAEANLTVNTFPVITLQPDDTGVCEHTNAGFTAGATGSGLNYQWQQSSDTGATWSAIPGATFAALSLDNVLFTMNGYTYRCEVTGTCLTTEHTLPAALIVTQPPDITQQPVYTTVCEGQTASFEITALSATAYSWQESADGNSWSDITGANLDTVTITAVAGINSYYRCIASGGCVPDAVSEYAVLTVNAPARIAADPGDLTVCEGQSDEFSVTVTGFEPTYKWQQSTDSGSVWSDLTETSPTSNTGVVTSAMDGYLYRCIVTGSCLPSDTSLAGALSVNLVPVITLHPEDSTICEGNDVLFTAGATGTGLSYQWYESTDNGFTWLPVSDAISDTLEISAVPATWNGYLYRCEISGACNPVAVTGNALLTVVSPLSLVADPTDFTGCESENALFEVAADGTALTYLWQESNDGGTTWSDLPSETSDALQLNNVTVSMNNYLYRCTVNGNCSSPSYSNSAMLIVTASPVITTDPVDFEVCENGYAQFSVTATGNGMTFLWQQSIDDAASWSDIPGADTDTLFFVTQPSMNLYEFRCIVSGECNFLDTTLGAILTVYTLPQPGIGNDTTVCYNQLVTLNAGTYDEYLWNDGTTSHELVVDTTGNYYVQVTDVNGCKNFSNNVLVSTLLPYNQENICVVTVDNSINENVIIWDKTYNNAIVTYNIYKANVYGVFELTGVIPFDSAGIFVDTASNPAQNYNRYKLSVIDTCGNESDLSQEHRTIKLSIDVNAGSNTLDWTASMGFGFATYRVYRGTTPENLEQIDMVDSTTLNWTDIDPPQCVLYYQVRADKPVACEVGDIAFGQSVSNTVDNGCTLPAVPVISGPAVMCENGTVNLSVPGGYSDYKWSNGDSTETITIYSGGDYALTATGQCNCVVYSDTFYVEEIPAPVVTISAAGLTTFCLGDSVQLYAAITNYDSTATYSYLWSSGQGDDTIIAINSGLYDVTVTNANYGCTGSSSPVAIDNHAPYSLEHICVVTVDTTDNKNLIVWEKTPDVGIVSYNVYRETAITDVYELIANLPFDSTSIFTDTASDPTAHYHKYKISVIDTCGNESPMSNSHKTIHLTINQGSGNDWNLIWQEYNSSGEFVVSSYDIYRRTAATQWQLIGSIGSTGGDMNSWVDNTGLAGVCYYYKVATIIPDACEVNLAKTQTGPYSQSVSNIDDNGIIDGLTGLSELALNLSVYPNPASGVIFVSLDLINKENIILNLFDSQHRLLISEDAGKQRGKFTKQLDLCQYAKGIYTIQIITESETLYRKVVVK